MAFELFLFRFVDGDCATLDPDAVLSAFQAHGIASLPEVGYIELSDGLGVDVGADDLAAGTATQLGLTVRGLSPALCELLFDLMSSSGLTTLVVDDPPLPLLADANLAPHLPADAFSAPVICSSSAELHRAISEPFRRWASWAGFA